jgi:hypothetical protein
MVIQPGLSESPTITAMAPLFCIYLTFVMNEHPPRFKSAIQSEQGGSTRLQPVGSTAGSTIKPILPFADTLGPNAALLSSNVSLDI